MALLHGCHRDSRLTKMQHGGHMQSTETKGLEEKLDDETSVSAGFSGIKKWDLLLLRDKPVFLDSQLLDFRVQSREFQVSLPHLFDPKSLVSLCNIARRRP
jgi:hypothetical protein